jgi:chromosome segregation ATPase
MEKYYQKLRKYQTKLSSAQNLAKQKLYQIKINQYNSMLNLTGGAGDAEVLQKQINDNLGNKLPSAIADILKEAKDAANLIKDTYTEDSVNNMLEKIKNQVTDAKDLFSKKLNELNDQIKRLTVKLSDLTREKEDIESGNCKNDEELREQIRQLKENIELMKKEIEEKEKTIKELRDELEKARNKEAESKDENDDLRKIIDSLEIHVGELTKQLNELLKAVQNIKSPGPKVLGDDNIKVILDQLKEIKDMSKEKSD